MITSLNKWALLASGAKSPGWAQPICSNESWAKDRAGWAEPNVVGEKINKSEMEKINCVLTKKGNKPPNIPASVTSGFHNWQGDFNKFSGRGKLWRCFVLS